MSHNFAKKFDKIVSKLTHKHKDTKIHTNTNSNDEHSNANDAHDDIQHESILQRMKTHLGQTIKHESTHLDGVPPKHVIQDDLKNSPFRGRILKRISFVHSLMLSHIDVSRFISLRFLFYVSHLTHTFQ